MASDLKGVLGRTDESIDAKVFEDRHTGQDFVFVEFNAWLRATMTLA